MAVRLYGAKGWRKPPSRVPAQEEVWLDDKTKSHLFAFKPTACLSPDYDAPEGSDPWGVEELEIRRPRTRQAKHRANISSLRRRRAKLLPQSASPERDNSPTRAGSNCDGDPNAPFDCEIASLQESERPRTAAMRAHARFEMYKRLRRPRKDKFEHAAPRGPRTPAPQPLPPPLIDNHDLLAAVETGEASFTIGSGISSFSQLAGGDNGSTFQPNFNRVTL